MTPVLQTIYSWPKGNCFQACVASVFDCPLSEVPNFFEDASSSDATWTQKQWEDVLSFAKTHGRKAFWLDPDLEEDLEFIKLLEAGDLYYIAFGLSPRGSYGHCVVMHKGKYVHDPMNDKFLSGAPYLYVGFEV